MSKDLKPEKLRNLKTGWLALLVLLALPLFGWGCKEESEVVLPSPAQDAGSEADVGDATVPEGWKVYVNEEWNFRFKYPTGWFVQEDKRFPDIIHVNFNPTQLPPIETHSDVFPVITLTVENGLVPFDKTEWNIEDETNVNINSRQIYKGTYHSQLLDNEVVAVYWWQSDGKTYTLVGFDSDPVTEQFLTSFSDQL